MEEKDEFTYIGSTRIPVFPDALFKGWAIRRLSLLERVALVFCRTQGRPEFRYKIWRGRLYVVSESLTNDETPLH